MIEDPPSDNPSDAPAERESGMSSQLRLFLRFLRFGFLAWGGPVAQIGLLKRELVTEERWIEPARFNRLLAVYQVLPGPEAHELCVHLGMMRGGRLGGVLAGLGFMLPGFVLILLLAWMYSRVDLSQQPVAAMLLGVQVGVIAIIARAVHRIGEHVLIDRPLWLIAGLAGFASLFETPFWVCLPVAGLAYALIAARRMGLGAAVLVLGAVLGFVVIAGRPEWTATASPAAVALHPAGVWALFFSGLKAGLLTFGGAYTAIPFVRDDTVERGWVTESQFLDSLALSGIIPAPLIIFATFVGFQAAGLAGALAITAGIFLPAFSFALLFYDRLERMIESERLHRFLEGVAAGVVGLIAVTTLELGGGVATAVPSAPIAALIFFGGLALLYGWKSKLNLLAVVVGSALLGLLFLAESRA